MKNDFEKKFNEEYAKLNDRQKEAVEALDGPVMVIAGPGTGKTQILALRIGNILKKTDTAPESVLALTFTNAGVISMRKRLLEIIGDTAYRVNIFTFHAFCEHVIREFPFYFDYLEGGKVISDLERVEIIESIIQGNEFKHLVSFHDEFSFLKKITEGILAIKKEGLSPEEFSAGIPEWEKELLSDPELYYKKGFGKYRKGDIKPAEKEKIEKKMGKARELGEIFDLYQKEIKNRGLYDFSDMVLYVLEELGRNKDLKADLQERYQQILVDEHQDTNQGQNAIMELLSDAPHQNGRPNIFMVGDEKQSIYRFQGASAETFSRFKKLYKDILSVTLVENYRSTADILNGARSMIQKSEEFKNTVKLNSNVSENEKIAVREFSNYKFELLFLAEDIKRKIENGTKAEEIAVLYRENKNVSEIKTVFDFYRIPYTIFSKEKILEDPNIRNLIRILRAVNDFDDDHHLGQALFARFLNLDPYDIVRVLDKYKSMRKGERKHIFAVLESKKILREIGAENGENLSDLSKTLKELKTDSMSADFQDFFKGFLYKIGYIKYMLSSADSRLQLIKIDKLFDEIKRQSARKKDYGLRDFLHFVSACEKYDLDVESSGTEIEEGVCLLTAHGSKGKEFESVYIANAVRKSWETRKRGGGGISLPVYQYDGDLEDERRLFYVAMTRAKRHLSISFSRTDNDGREHEVSEFVKEIGPDFKAETDMKEFESKKADRLDAFLSAERRSASLFEPRYIRELFFERGLNVTALNNYLDCPKKYLYKNLLRIPDAYSSTLQFGSIIHKALESFFVNSGQAKKILPLKKLLSFFEAELRRISVPEREEKKFRENGKKLLEEYYGEYSGSWTFKAETEFKPKRDFELKGGEKLKLTGSIDKLERNEDSSVNLIDYKTGRSFSEKSKSEKENYERQIVFYHLLLENHEDMEIRESVLDFVKKNKKGEFERYSLEVTPDRLEKLRAEINIFAKEVLSMDFLRKGCNKSDCQWCQLEK